MPCGMGSLCLNPCLSTHRLETMPNGELVESLPITANEEEVGLCVHFLPLFKVGGEDSLEFGVQKDHSSGFLDFCLVLGVESTLSHHGKLSILDSSLDLGEGEGTCFGCTETSFEEEHQEGVVCVLLEGIPCFVEFDLGEGSFLECLDFLRGEEVLFGEFLMGHVKRCIFFNVSASQRKSPKVTTP